MHRRIRSLFLALALCLSLTACTKQETAEASTQTTESAAVESLAGTYTGIGLYADGHYLTDEYFKSWTTTLNADGSGSIQWDETVSSISAWSVQDGKLSIQAGASEVTGSLTDGVMLLELDETYVVAFVTEGYDLSGLSTAPLDEYMTYVANKAYAGTYTPFAIGMNGVCVALEESEDGAMTLNADGTAVCITGDVENHFTYTINGNAITFTDGADSMSGTIENGILILNISAVQSDGTVQDMQGYYALPGADTSGISVITPEEYQAAAQAETADAQVAELEARYASVTEDALSWYYDEGTRTLTVSGEGAMKSYAEFEPDWYACCQSAEHIVVADGVSSVSYGAFYGFSVAVDVSLGASVEYIGDYAFVGCDCLWTVNFPASLKYVGNWSFGNTVLHSDSFVFPEGMLYIGPGAFYSAIKVAPVYIPASLTQMAEDAFDNAFVTEFQVSPDNPAYTAENGILYNKDKTTLINYPAGKTDSAYVIPGTVTTILDEAIEVTNTLETIVIPASVTNIEEGAIFWNYALKSIVVDENNPCYKSVDGALYTKDGKTLLCYPIADPRTEYTVLEGCERIGIAALSQANSLTAIYIPEGVREIGRLALYGMQGLTQLTLPEILTTVEELALNSCSALREIHYAGSSETWQTIAIGEQNELITNGSVAILYGK